MQILNYITAGVTGLAVIFLAVEMGDDATAMRRLAYAAGALVACVALALTVLCAS